MTSKISSKLDDSVILCVSRILCLLTPQSTTKKQKQVPKTKQSNQLTQVNEMTDANCRMDNLRIPKCLQQLYLFLDHQGKAESHLQFTINAHFALLNVTPSQS